MFTPSALYTLPEIGDLMITKLDLDLKLLEPTENSVVTANTLFEVKWDYSKGLSY